MTLDIQTVLIVLLANAVATAIALPVIMGWRVSLAARAFQGASVAQALGWLAFLVATRIDDRLMSSLSMACLSGSFVLLWVALNGWLSARPGRVPLMVLAVLTPAGYFLSFDHYALRVGWSNAGLTLQMLILCAALVAPAPQASRRWRGLVLLCMLTLAAVTAWRGVLGAFFTAEYPFYRATHPVNMAAALLYHVALAMCTIGLLVAWREEAERSLKQQAQTDGLTGLLNRQSFGERAEKIVATAHRYGDPLSLLMLDVDHFKRINDGFGHATGDDALRTMAAALSACVRGGDLISRHGGEEFCVLLNRAGLADGDRFDDRLRAWLRSEVEKLPHALDFSGGLAELQPDESVDALLRRADAALYHAKAAGRGRTKHADIA
ncbi:GGDEF domain-containing protein [Rhizobacter sp. LjRoot28]|uniref:GGDEF domain-containing protein n=1 Tax=Rhizobacter sp. LjRoot28 TaxID=3342309 RepID=UPI003ECC22AD